MVLEISKLLHLVNLVLMIKVYESIFNEGGLLICHFPLRSMIFLSHSLQLFKNNFIRM